MFRIPEVLSEPLTTVGHRALVASPASARIASPGRVAPIRRGRPTAVARSAAARSPADELPNLLCRALRLVFPEGGSWSGADIGNRTDLDRCALAPGFCEGLWIPGSTSRTSPS